MIDLYGLLTRPLLLTTVALVAVLSPCAAHAQAFPSQPVRIVVPTTVGGSNDLIARAIARELGRTWTAGVVVDNKPGAGGVIGFDAVAKAAPNGYTFTIGSSQFTGSASTYARLPYDPLKDLAPVSLLALSQWVIAADPALAARSVQELVALARDQPGRMNFASAGTGGGNHLAAELFKKMTGTDIAHIPYKGTVEAINDVMTGRVQFTITSLPPAMKLAAAGKLRLLAVTGRNRSTIAPDLPTIAETVPGYEFNNWFGAFAPGGTPAETIAQINQALVRTLQSKEVRQFLLNAGIEPTGTTAAAFGETVRSEIVTYTRLVRELGIRVE